MPRLLHHHNRLLARPNRRHLRRLLDRAVPADGWECAIDRGLLVQAEVDVYLRRLSNEGGVEGVVSTDDDDDGGCSC